MNQINSQQIEEAIGTWARAILAGDKERELAVVGLISHGDALAQRLVKAIKAAGCPARYGALDISLYRDDLGSSSRRPALRTSYLPFSTDGLRVVLVDDVLHTGRTVRAALNALFDYGRPASVELHCLVDRGGRELPIEPHYAAFTLGASVEDVRVHLRETEGEDAIVITEAKL